ncbi:MAG: hypothetical protein GX609_01935 [Actinomycetales bacterium]|nr:hypothetical protein [Actinomycetales bacterium]
MSPRPDPRPGRGARRPRRAVRPATHEPARDPAAEPVLPRSPDESDVGWGERPDSDDDERLRREVPPHWGRD